MRWYWWLLLLLVVDVLTDLLILALLGRERVLGLVAWAWARGPLWPGAPAWLARPAAGGEPGQTSFWWRARRDG